MASGSRLPYQEKKRGQKQPSIPGWSTVSVSESPKRNLAQPSDCMGAVHGRYLDTLLTLDELLICSKWKVYRSQVRLSSPNRNHNLQTRSLIPFPGVTSGYWLIKVIAETRPSSGLH